MAAAPLFRLLWAAFVGLAAAQARPRTTTRSGSSSVTTTTRPGSTSSSSHTRSATSVTLSTLSTTRSSSSTRAETTRTTTLTTTLTTRSTTSSTTPGRTSTSTTKTSSSLTSATSTSSNACPTAAPTDTTCPSAWTTIIAELAPLFRDSNGECTDMARAAVRYAFHDAAGYSNRTTPYYPASGGVDGSLLLSATEITRPDNDGLGAFHSNITAKYNQYRSNCATRVGAADLVQVLGWLGVQACPGGRIGRVYVGRNDTDQAAPDGTLPKAFGPGSDHDTILQLFQDMGFTARDLAALMGAHSSSKAFFQTQHGIPAGTPQDSTPGVWDANYYTEIYESSPGVGHFDSDINLSNRSTAVGQNFPTMQNLFAWQSAYSSAHQKMSLLGLAPDARFSMQDCTSLISRAVFS